MVPATEIQASRVACISVFAEFSDQHDINRLGTAREGQPAIPRPLEIEHPS
jgi:hypothetical protein